MKTAAVVLSSLAVCLVIGSPRGLAAPGPDTPPPAAPPAVAPPPAAHPAAPPQPVRRTRYSRYEKHWYIGFAIGGSGGWATLSRESSAASGGGVALSVIRIGWIARPWFLLGVEASGSVQMNRLTPAFDNEYVLLLHYDVMATFYPLYDRGLYTKIGAGVGVAQIESTTWFGAQTSQETRYGLDLRAGVGYEWPLLRSFNLGLELIYGLVVFRGGFGHDVAGLLTFSWY